jgi:rhamnogalacturonan endolyase
LAVFVPLSAHAQTFVMEKLGRGVIAVRQDSSSVYVGWRLLGTDPEGVTFNVYRSTAGGPGTLLNDLPIADRTSFVDTGADLDLQNAYSVRAVVDGAEEAPGAPFVLPAGAAVGQFLSIPLQRPPDGVTPGGEPYSYDANDAGVGDLDGDGEYEIVLKWEPSNAKDNSQDGYTGNVYLDAYALWARLCASTHRTSAPGPTTQFMVYDLDSDGRRRWPPRRRTERWTGPGR